MNTQEKAKFDQDMTLICESFPSAWWRIYNNCVKEGFTKEQAMDVLKIYILSVRPTS